MSRREDILARVGRTPSLPVAVVKAIPMLRDVNADLAEIARVIRLDPGLAANVLRLSNSAALGARHKVSTLEAAVARLGSRRMMGLVLSSTIGPMQCAPVRGYDLDRGALWRHAAAVGIATRALLDLLGRKPAPHAETAALLIDTGKMVLGLDLEVDGRAIARRAYESNTPFEQAEREVLGIDHAEVGAALLRHWGLPEELVQVTRWHHEPTRCPTEHREVVDLVHAADQLCTLCGIGAGLDGCQYLPCQETLTSLGLSEEVFDRALCRVVEGLQEADELFEKPLAGSK